MPDPYDPLRITLLAKKWRDGSITESEKREFERWYEMAEESDVSRFKTDDDLKEFMYRAIVDREHIYAENLSTVLPGSRSIKIRRLAVAAVLTFLLFFSSLYFILENKYSAPTGLRLATARSFIHKELLPDGTIIWLKPGASISYPLVFGSTRNVSLKGEALFEVAKDKRHPFIISAGNYTATVLGTSFNLKQASKNNIELVVLTGKVRIASKEGHANFKPLDVFPSEKLLTSDVVRKTKVADQDNKPYLEGTEYDMNFVNSPFEDVAKRIEKKFDVDVHYNIAQYIHCRFTANLTDQSLNQTLALLTISLNANYQVGDKQVTIQEGGCP